MIDLKNHKMGIFGIQGSGKTYFAQHMFTQFRAPLIFQVNEDDAWDKLKGIYVYKADRLKMQEEFKTFIQWAYKQILAGKVDLLIIDEADLFIQTNWDLSPELQDIVLNHRHLGPKDKEGVALWLITRRPQDIPTKIVETCRFIVIFKLEGFNAIKRFGEIHADLPDMIEKLQYDRHNFVLKELGKPPIIHKPI